MWLVSSSDLIILTKNRQTPKIKGLIEREVLKNIIDFHLNYHQLPTSLLTTSDLTAIIEGCLHSDLEIIKLNFPSSWVLTHSSRLLVQGFQNIFELENFLLWLLLRHFWKKILKKYTETPFFSMVDKSTTRHSEWQDSEELLCVTFYVFTDSMS